MALPTPVLRYLLPCNKDGPAFFNDYPMGGSLSRSLLIVDTVAAQARYASAVTDQPSV